MENFDIVQLNANLSEKAYTDYTQADVENHTVTFTDTNGSNWDVPVNETNLGEK